jgi:hypothetical protein
MIVFKYQRRQIYQESYSKHFIFFITYDLSNKFVLHYTAQERLGKDKHYSILGFFISYEENEVL